MALTKHNSSESVITSKLPKFHFFRIDFPVSAFASGERGMSAIVKFLDTQQAYILKKLAGGDTYRILLRKYVPCTQKDAARFLYRHMTPQGEKRLLRITVRPVHDVKAEYPEMLQENGEGCSGAIRFKDRDVIENSLGEMRLPRKPRPPRPSKPKVKKPMSAAEKKRRNQKKNKRKRIKKNRKPEKNRVRKPRDRTKELLKRREKRQAAAAAAAAASTGRPCVGCADSTAPCGRPVTRSASAVVTNTHTNGMTTRSTSRLANSGSRDVPESEMMFVPRVCSRPGEPVPCDDYHPSYSDSTSSYSSEGEDSNSTAETAPPTTPVPTTPTPSPPSPTARDDVGVVTAATPEKDLRCYEDIADLLCYGETTITDYLSSPSTSDTGEPASTNNQGDGNCCFPGELPFFRVPEDVFPDIPDELPVLSHDFVEECLEDKENALRPQNNFAAWDDVRFWMDYLVGVPEENLFESYVDACTRNNVTIVSMDQARCIVETISTCRILQDLASHTSSCMQQQQQQEQELFCYKPQIFTPSLGDEIDYRFMRDAVLTPL